MSILLMIHSIVRWILVVVALIALIKMIIGVTRKGTYDSMSKGVMSGFIGLFDLQVLLGIIYIVWSGLAGAGFPGYRLIHGGIMVLAAIVAHSTAAWKKSPDATRYRNNLISLIIVLILVYIGVAVLPQGWVR